nr:glycosyltransferase N-terminal domain-containing protein [uncultured Allomuricauda sp.]
MLYQPIAERMYFSGNINFVRFLYSFLIFISWNVLKVIAIFSSKIKLFVSGRKNTFSILNSKNLAGDSTIWLHTASLGEYEQGLPILERLKREYPKYKIVLTFFSPSGYEVKKDKTPADCVVYLPLDTQKNAKQFIETINPEIAIFIKYEIWPNYLRELKLRNIQTILVSAIFSKRQIFFKPFGGFMRNSLKSFNHFFVQDQSSQKLLNSIGIKNVTISGDTRFDRVTEILGQENSLDFMNSFKGNDLCLVAGSTWPEDEEIIIDFINTSQKTIKYVIAPHTIKPAHIEKIEVGITKKTIRFSNKGNDLPNCEVIIIDTIGLLTKIYSYADIAYVGGAFATGLHNTLEPAVFGIPVVIGPNYTGFKEAEDLVNKKGIHPISNAQEFNDVMSLFLEDDSFKEKMGKINLEYIQGNVGSTQKILNYIKSVL